MSWFVLVLSGVMEAVWATALGRSEGFSRLGPTVGYAMAAGDETISLLKVVFLVGIVGSVIGLKLSH